jgi:hypothetical protein
MVSERGLSGTFCLWPDFGVALAKHRRNLDIEKGRQVSFLKKRFV